MDQFTQVLLAAECCCIGKTGYLIFDQGYVLGLNPEGSARALQKRIQAAFTAAGFLLEVVVATELGQKAGLPRTMKEAVGNQGVDSHPDRIDPDQFQGVEQLAARSQCRRNQHRDPRPQEPQHAAGVVAVDPDSLAASLNLHQEAFFPPAKLRQPAPLWKKEQTVLGTTTRHLISGTIRRASRDASDPPYPGDIRA